MFQWFVLSRYMALLFILMMYFASSIAVPEVVYPSLRRKQENRIYSYSEKSTSASDFLQALQFRRALANYRKKRRLQENRIIVAPIDGLRVYTKEKFTEIIDGPAKYSGSSTTIKRIGTCCDSSDQFINGTSSRIMGVPIQSPHDTVGRSSVSELNIDDLPQAGVKVLDDDGKPNSPTEKNRPQTNALKIPRFNLGTSNRSQTFGFKSLMSYIPRQPEDPPVPQAAKVRFPANSWQLPPELLSNRNSKNIVDQRPSFYNTRQNTFEETPNGFYLTTRVAPTFSQPTTPFSPMSSINEGNFAPRQVYSEQQNVFKIPVDRSKAHATFAKHNDRVAPIPLPEERMSVEETDMDLLGKHTTRSFLQNLIPTSTLPSFPSPIEPVVGTQPPSLRKQLYSKLTPNEKLSLCCQKQGLTNGCQTLCNFDYFSDKTLVSAFLTNQCPGPQLGQAFDCASTQVDHTACCQRSNVHFFNGGQCMLFCRSEKPGNVFSYLGCLPVIEVIKQCYREYQTTHPNLFGD